MSGFVLGVPGEAVALREAGLDIIPSATSDVLGAVAEQAFVDSPTPRLARTGARNSLYGIAPLDQPSGDVGAMLGQLPIPTTGLFGDLGRQMRERITLSPEEANREFKAPGMTPFTAPIPVPVAQSIFDAHQDKLARANVISRRDGGILTGQAAQFTTSILTGLLDPVNVASAFLPIVPGAKVAAWLSTAASTGGRAGVRAGVGAVEGAAGALLLEPLIYLTDRAEHNDWTMGNAALNIALGAAMGGVLHTGVGAVADWRAGAADRAAAARIAEMSPETREMAARGAIAQVSEDRPARVGEAIDAAEITRAADELKGRMAAVDALANDVQLIPEVRTLAEEVRTIGARSRNESAPVSLLEFVGIKGGVQDQGGDLKAIGADMHFVPGQGRIVRKNGLTLDYMREAAEEAGYLPPNSTVADLLDKIAEEVSGRRVYLPHEYAIAHERRLERLSERERERVNEYRSTLLELSDEYGIRLNEAQLEHAMILSMDGAHPEEAIRMATIGDDLSAMGFLKAAADEVESAARIAAADAAAIEARITSLAREIDELRKTVEPAEGSIPDQLAKLDKLQSDLDAIVEAERASERLTPEQERMMAEFAEQAKRAEGDAKAMEAAGFCAAARG